MRAHRMLAAAALGALLCAPRAPGQDAAPAAPPKPAMPLTAPAPQGGDVTALRNEVADLRDDIRLLQKTLDVLVNQMMADLRAQNELLRDEVARLRAQSAALGLPEPPAVPRPGGEALEDILLEEPAPPAPPPFEFSVVSEWGRDAETAAELGGDAATLKGLVGAVPPGSARADIENLGRELRAQYAGYDNINIEVFDDAEAARAYADGEKGAAAHRVLSVSRHKASGRDTILYIQNGKAEPVAFEPGETPPPEDTGAGAAAPVDLVDAADAVDSSAEDAPAPPAPILEPAPAPADTGDAGKGGDTAAEDGEDGARSPKSVMGRGRKR